MAFGEDDAVEWIVKLDVHLHPWTITLHVQLGDLWHYAEHVAYYGKLENKEENIGFKTIVTGPFTLVQSIMVILNELAHYISNKQ